MVTNGRIARSLKGWQGTEDDYGMVELVMDLPDSGGHVA